MYLDHRTVRTPLLWSIVKPCIHLVLYEEKKRRKKTLLKYSFHSYTRTFQTRLRTSFDYEVRN